MSVLDASPVLEAFLAAEIRNADDGGDWPVTLATARDSLAMMDNETLNGLNPAIARMGADHAAMTREIERLIDRHGADRQIDDDIDQDAGRV